MTLRIRKPVIDDVTDHALHDAPVEACGYLAGDGKEIRLAVRMRNADESTEHYSFDPGEQFETVRDLRKRGLMVMAAYHSHPSSPARMSQEDLRLAHDPDISYVIVSLEGGSAMVKSFRLMNGTAEEEKLDITQQSA